MSNVPVRGGSSFEWRVQTGRWRWVILGAIGAAPYGCGGRTDAADGDSSGANLQGNGGSSAGTTTSGTTLAGSGGWPSSGGSAMVGSAGASMGEGGTSEGGAGGSVTTTTRSSCQPPFTDLGGGWERCGNGMLHRPSLGSCASSVPRAEPALRTNPAPYETPDAGFSGECQSDSDCTAKTYGHCESSPYVPGNYCEYGCVTNADCDPGYACLCGEPVGACMPASCATDAECGSGLLCSDYTFEPGCGGTALGCQSPADACAAASDCGPSQYCTVGSYDTPPAAGAARYCTGAQCVIGRPFLIGGHERLAPEEVRSDWYPQTRSEAAVAALDVELSVMIRRGWLEQALMEHASVAAFARFSLQLLALGAPAELVARSASAMGDEIEHARACFDLARRHGEADAGPGVLDMSGALESTELESVLLGTIAEGCIGETVAAIEAAEACAHCEDAAARSVLERIAGDETQHAELAWRFVSWALEVGPVALRERAHAAFALAMDRAAPALSEPSVLDRELARHGLIGGSLRSDLRSRVLREVIAPCARALLDPPASPSVARSHAAGAAHGSDRALA